VEFISCGVMTTELANNIEKVIQSMKEQLNGLQFGNIEFVIINGRVDRVDIKQSIKTEKSKG
jgi:hypothetical protein